MKRFLVVLAGVLLLKIADSSVIPSSFTAEFGKDALETGSNDDTLIFSHVVRKYFRFYLLNFHYKWFFFIDFPAR